jgi:hypothetical protein
VRLPNSLSIKTIVLEDISFAYGQEEILKKDKKGWTVFITVDKDKPNKISK